LTGWPDVIALEASGKPTAASHARFTMFEAWQYHSPLPFLRLRPGASAYAIFAASDISAFSEEKCPSYRWLKIAPPGGAGHVTLPAWLYGNQYLPACTSITGRPQVEVSPVESLSSLVH
jgi:hypothetical protein